MLDIKRFILSALLVSAFAVVTYPQVKSDKITSGEIKAANALAHRFARRLLETKNIQKLINEFFVGDFSQRLSLDVHEHDWQLLREDQIRPEGRRQLFRYYVAETNFLYLFTLMTTSQHNVKRYSDIDAKQGDNQALAAVFNDLPSDLRSVFRKNDTWTLILKNEASFDVDNPETTESAIAYFDRTLRFLEQTYPMLRRAAIQVNAGRSRSFKKNMLELEKNGDIHIYKPIERECDKYYPCFGFREGTRMIDVEFLPLFQLTLTRLAGKLRVVDFNFAVP